MKNHKISAQHILVNQKYEAEDILGKLRDGESFEQLAKEYSLCSSAEQGGHLGEFTRGMMVAAFEKAAFGLEPGEVSEPIKTQFGHHIIKRIS